jgi:hypothetical protein
MTRNQKTVNMIILSAEEIEKIRVRIRQLWLEESFHADEAHWLYCCRPTEVEEISQHEQRARRLNTARVGLEQKLAWYGLEA